MLNNIHAHKIAGGRIVKEDGSTMNLGDSLDRVEDIMELNSSNKVLRVPFDGELNPVVTDTNVITSDPIEIRKFKKVTILIENTSGSDIAVDFLTQFLDPVSDWYNMQNYDWNTEKWVFSYMDNSGVEGEGHVTVPSSNFTLTNITTHPNFYWLSDFGGSRIRLRFKATGTPSGTGDVKVWVVGEPYA